MSQVVTIDTKTVNNLIEAILSLKSEVAFLRKQNTLSEDSFDMSTNTALEEMENGNIVEFTDINDAINHLHS